MRVDWAVTLRVLTEFKHDGAFVEMDSTAKMLITGDDEACGATWAACAATSAVRMQFGPQVNMHVIAVTVEVHNET